MAHNFTRGDRVRIVSGPRAGQTGKVMRPHGGKGFAGYLCLWMDGTDWDAPGFAAPASNLERL